MKKYTITAFALLVVLSICAAVFWGRRMEDERGARIEAMIRAVNSNESRDAITAWIDLNLKMIKKDSSGHSTHSISIDQPFIWPALGIDEKMINSSVYAEVGPDGKWIRILFDASRTGIIVTRAGWGDYEPYIVARNDGFAAYARND